MKHVKLFQNVFFSNNEYKYLSNYDVTYNAIRT